MGSREIPLMRAAARARVGYGVLLGAVLRAQVEGRQDAATRRWFVSVESLDRWIARRAANGRGSPIREGVA